MKPTDSPPASESVRLDDLFASVAALWTTENGGDCSLQQPDGRPERTETVERKWWVAEWLDDSDRWTEAGWKWSTEEQALSSMSDGNYNDRWRLVAVAVVERRTVRELAVHGSPIDPKLSDGGGWRGLCRRVERWRWSAAQAVTAVAVRCSAWLGVAVIAIGAVRATLFVRRWFARIGIEAIEGTSPLRRLKLRVARAGFSVFGRIHSFLTVGMEAQNGPLRRRILLLLDVVAYNDWPVPRRWSPPGIRHKLAHWWVKISAAGYREALSPSNCKGSPNQI
jgi:hypothetical protein